MSARSHFASNAIKASLFAVLALCTLALGACSHSGPRQNDPNAFTWNGELAAPATVQVRNTLGAITVEPSPDNMLRVVAATSWTRGDPKRDVQFRVATANNIVTVCALWGSGECTATDYSTKSRRKGVSVGWSSRSDASVAFKLQVPAGVKVDAFTVSGAVDIRASAPVRARSVDGDIKIGTAVGPVNAETMNGDVDVRMTTIGDTGAVRAVTKNGDAVAWVPEIADGSLEASTINGEIGTDFGGPVGEAMGRSRKFSTLIGTGSREYVVQTLNGSAWLRLINPDGTVGLKATSAAPRVGSKATITAQMRKRNQ